MNAQDSLSQHLARYALPAQFTSGPELVDLATDDGRLTLELTALDVVGCSFQRLTLETPRLANATLAQLKEKSEALCKRVRYLLEPLGPLELDPESCTVQMRSIPPQTDGGGASYYEMLVKRGGEISLCRYRKDRGLVRHVEKRAEGMRWIAQRIVRMIGEGKFVAKQSGQNRGGRGGLHRMSGRVFREGWRRDWRRPARIDDLIDVSDGTDDVGDEFGLPARNERIRLGDAKPGIGLGCGVK